MKNDYVLVRFQNSSGVVNAMQELDVVPSDRGNVVTWPPSDYENIETNVSQFQSDSIVSNIQENWKDPLNKNDTDFRTLLTIIKEILIEEFKECFEKWHHEPWEDSAINRRRFAYDRGQTLFFYGPEVEQNMLFNKSIWNWSISLLIKSVGKFESNLKLSDDYLMPFDEIEKLFLGAKRTKICYEEYVSYKKCIASLFRDRKFKKVIDFFNPIPL